MNMFKTMTGACQLDMGRSFGPLTISKDEPEDTERSPNPSGAEGLLVGSDGIQDIGPVLT